MQQFNITEAESTSDAPGAMPEEIANTVRRVMCPRAKPRVRNGFVQMSAVVAEAATGEPQERDDGMISPEVAHAAVVDIRPEMSKATAFSPDELGTRRAINALLSAPSDKANGRWFAMLYGDVLRFNSDTERWFEWDGKRWLRCKDTQIERFAKMASDEMAKQAIALTLEDEKRQLLLKRACDVSNVGKWQAMLTSARSEDMMMCGVDDFNSNWYLLNCLNGTLNLKTGVLREHRREDMMTTLVPVNYDPKAKSVLWERTLEQIFATLNEATGEWVPNYETIAFFKRAIGYTLTGSTQEECFFFLYGIGRNGKGTSVAPFGVLLNQMVAIASFGMFLEDRNPNKEGATPGMASLVGARMVLASEAKRGTAFDESIVKTLTGSDKIKARELYGNPFEFTPQFKVWFQANNRPAVSASDYAFWERCKLIPYARQFEASDRDQTLKATLLLEENLEGILAWAVEGCREWQHAAEMNHGRGLGTCEAVEEGTREYQEENNHLTRWIEEQCVLHSGDGLVSDLWDNYSKSWVLDRTNRVAAAQRLNQQEFGRQLKAMGYPLKMPSKKKRVGIRLMTDGDRNRAAIKHLDAAVTQ
jgi:putative DNA primase/helicase